MNLATVKQSFHPVTLHIYSASLRYGVRILGIYFCSLPSNAVRVKYWYFCSWMKGFSKTVLKLWNLWKTTLGDHMHKLETLAWYQCTSLQNLCSWRGEGQFLLSLIPLSKQFQYLTRICKAYNNYTTDQATNASFVTLTIFFFSILLFLLPHFHWYYLLLSDCSIVFILPFISIVLVFQLWI